MDIDRDRYWPWLAFAVENAMARGLTDAADLLTFVTPDVLVAQLPHEVTTAIVAAALQGGALTPELVLQKASPSVLAEHLESELLWRCLTTAAQRAHLDSRDETVSDPAKDWLQAILERALADGMVTPAEVVQFVPPAEFVRDAPLAVVAELIRDGLLGGKFDPKLVLDHLTPSVIAHKLRPALGWSCISNSVKRQFGLEDAPVQPKAPKAKPAVVTKAGAVLEKTKLNPVVPNRSKSNGPATEWTDVDGGELDVIEEQALPQPPAVRPR
jgi:hypothetical protein